MVGMYKDPKGETITSAKEEATTDTNGGPTTELKMLRHRVVELEAHLRKHVSFIFHVYILLCVLHMYTDITGSLSQDN